MELIDTIGMMKSADFKERFKAEYAQLLIRYIKLVKMVRKLRENKLEFLPNTTKQIYDIQLEAMEKYLNALVIRAKMENIDLTEINKIKEEQN